MFWLKQISQLKCIESSINYYSSETKLFKASQRGDKPGIFLDFVIANFFKALCPQQWGNGCYPSKHSSVAVIIALNGWSFFYVRGIHIKDKAFGISIVF